MRWHEVTVLLTMSLLQRLNEARRMMDKLRACIVANYYANAGLPKLQEVRRAWNACVSRL